MNAGQPASPCGTPVKDLKPVEKFHRDLAASGIPKVMAAHFMIRPPADPDKFNGCGMIIVNPPWTLRTSGYNRPVADRCSGGQQPDPL